MPIDSDESLRIEVDQRQHPVLLTSYQDDLAGVGRVDDYVAVNISLYELHHIDGAREVLWSAASDEQRAGNGSNRGCREIPAAGYSRTGSFGICPERLHKLFME